VCHFLAQQRWGNRLRQEVVTPCGQGLLSRTLCSACAHGDNGDGAERIFQSPDAAGRFPAVHLRHHQVHEDEVWCFALDELKSFLAICGLSEFVVSVLTQQRPEEMAVYSIVIGNQDFLPAHSVLPLCKERTGNTTTAASFLLPRTHPL